MVVVEKTKGGKSIITEKKSFTIDWNWLFEKCSGIFTVIFFVGFVIFCFWLLEQLQIFQDY